MNGMAVLVRTTMFPGCHYNGETGRIVSTRPDQWPNGEPCTIATVRMNGISLCVEFALCELSEL